MIYCSYKLTPELGGYWACMELGVYGTLSNVQQAVEQISANGWTTANIETFAPPARSEKGLTGV